MKKTLFAVLIVLVATCGYLIFCRSREHQKQEGAGPVARDSGSPRSQGYPVLRSKLEPALPPLSGKGSSQPPVIQDTKTFVTEKECQASCGAPCVLAPNGARQCGKQCNSNDDCDSDAVCFPTTTLIGRCRTSECSGVGKDADCGEGTACNPVVMPSGAIFECVNTGTRQSGESCIGIGNEHSPPNLICSAGLACEQGTCLPLVCEQDAGCPAGSRCRADATGFLAEKRCEQGCASDAECKSGMKCTPGILDNLVCANIVDAQCLVAKCTNDLQCVITMPLLSRVHADCVKSCKIGDSGSCGQGTTCAQVGFGEAAAAYCMQSCKSDTDCRTGNICALTGISGICRPVVAAESFAK